ncbi:hypothetical protein C8J56DRAFT_900110 [Mycena floridula]|nr:hypothetical protein C8J56DRAFT_900110 [Mycena floridula]
MPVPSLSDLKKALRNLEEEQPQNLLPQAIPLSTILNNTEPALDAEKEVQRGLDDLEEIGALQATNRMRIEDLLNPSDEKDIIQECSDRDIFQAVMDVRAARENAEITGGADDADDDAAVIIRPSRSEALKAVSTIQQFLSPVDEPFARKLEGLLASFGRQTRLEGLTLDRELFWLQWRFGSRDTAWAVGTVRSVPQVHYE